MWNRLAVIWVGGLILLSLQPARPDAGSGLADLHRPFHFLAYAVTVLLLSRSFRSPWKAAVATILLGTAIEMLQCLIYRGPMEWWDVRDNALAALAVFLPLTARWTRGQSASG